MPPARGGKAGEPRAIHKNTIERAQWPDFMAAFMAFMAAHGGSIEVKKRDTEHSDKKIRMAGRPGLPLWEGGDWDDTAPHPWGMGIGPSGRGASAGDSENRGAKNARVKIYEKITPTPGLPNLKKSASVPATCTPHASSDADAGVPIGAHGPAAPGRRGCIGCLI